jgi:hypothetical protein
MREHISHAWGGVGAQSEPVPADEGSAVPHRRAGHASLAYEREPASRHGTRAACLYSMYPMFGA